MEMRLFRSKLWLGILGVILLPALIVWAVFIKVIEIIFRRQFTEW